MRTLICAFLFAALAIAADVTGNYSGTFISVGPDGQPNESTAYVVLKQMGTQITGSGGPDASRQFPIRNGKITGAKITGEAVDPQGPVYKFSLTVAGEKIGGDIEVTNPDGRVLKARLELSRVK